MNDTIKSLRSAAGLTQRQLAEAAGLSNVWIARVERGEIAAENISLKNALALAAALGVEPKELLK